MKIYAVGGSVRDALLGLPIADRDYVVVGSTPEAMERLGYRPVGRDFPVFLHPQTHEEYALARTERKSAPGYAGFVFHTDPSVTLEEDLARRDLTINAMAQDDDGRIIDPFGGQADLARRVLRHVGAAFVEDPVRVLRLARFCARYVDFSVAPETLELLRTMVEKGEVDALVPERVWREFAVGLMEARPSRMLALLAGCGALERLLPELGGALENPWLALDLSATRQRPLAVRVAVWLAEAGLSAVRARGAAERIRIPAAPAELAQIVIAEQDLIGAHPDLGAESLVGLFERSDALRRTERFQGALDALSDLASARQAPFDRAALEAALERVRNVDAGAVAQSAAPGAIAAAVHAARVAALQRAAS